MNPDASIAILGGTGKEGRGIALRLAIHGRRVILGSRDPEKGRRIASELNARLQEASQTAAFEIAGAGNQEAADLGDVIVSTLPYDGHLDTVRDLGRSLAGKLVVTATIRWPPGLDGKPSAAEELAAALAGTSRVAAAFQTVSAKTLARIGHRGVEPDEPGEDVLVFADEPDARKEALLVVAATGMRAVDVGALAGARVAEALTGLLLGVNKIYGVRSTGIRITGLPGEAVET